MLLVFFTYPLCPLMLWCQWNSDVFCLTLGAKSEFVIAPAPPFRESSHGLSMCLARLAIRVDELS